MQSRKIGEIKAAIRDQAYNGRRSVRINAGRVINVRTAKGQLQARTISGAWHNVESVTIE